MIELTQSLSHWLWKNHRKELPLIMLGHTELLTDTMYNEYIDWCKTDEGQSYLQGGENYKEE